MSPEPSRFADPTTVETRRTSFGAGAAAYDRLRPGWPADAVTWLLGDPAGTLDVLDLGAGTGLGTRAVAGLGHRVVAVEPSAAMLAALEAATATLDADAAARVDGRLGAAEALPLDDACVDAVLCFQAWRWVEREQAGAECRRVLRPGGRLGLAWHSWADLPWLRDLGDLVGTPEMVWDETGGGAADDTPVPGFGPAEHARFGFRQSLSPDDLAGLAATWSPVAVREDRDAVLAAVRDLGVRVAGPDGRLGFDYVTTCYRSVRSP